MHPHKGWRGTPLSSLQLSVAVEYFSTKIALVAKGDREIEG